MADTTPPLTSYSQRFEDLYLGCCFPDRRDGFYIDIGNGHPVYDNVSFAFYLRGWNGITVEPNPWLSQLANGTRPRDKNIQTLIGATRGEASFHLVNDYHGLSTMIADHARQAQSEFGKASQASKMPVTTLQALCEQYAPASFEFLKIDVEGAEEDVIRGGDWKRFRPKVVVIEALAPYTLAPAWDSWEPVLSAHGYRYARFDSLNRYYVAEEEKQIVQFLTDAPDTFDATLFRDVKPALESDNHPDHRLALLLNKADMIRLPVLENEFLAGLITAGLPAESLDRPAADSDIAGACKRVFGHIPQSEWLGELRMAPQATIRDVYARLVETDRFRTACGRISASYAW
jgi:FkbM family methyltransferase